MFTQLSNGISWFSKPKTPENKNDALPSEKSQEPQKGKPLTTGLFSMLNPFSGGHKPEEKEKSSRNTKDIQIETPLIPQPKTESKDVDKEEPPKQSPNIGSLFGHFLGGVGKAKGESKNNKDEEHPKLPETGKNKKPDKDDNNSNEADKKETTASKDRSNSNGGWLGGLNFPKLKVEQKEKPKPKPIPRKQTSWWSRLWTPTPWKFKIPPIGDKLKSYLKKSFGEETFEKLCQTPKITTLGERLITMPIDFVEKIPTNCLTPKLLEKAKGLSVQKENPLAKKFVKTFKNKPSEHKVGVIAKYLKMFTGEKVMQELSEKEAFDVCKKVNVNNLPKKTFGWNIYMKSFAKKLSSRRKSCAMEDLLSLKNCLTFIWKDYKPCFEKMTCKQTAAFKDSKVPSALSKIVTNICKKNLDGETLKELPCESVKELKVVDIPPKVWKTKGVIRRIVKCRMDEDDKGDDIGKKPDEVKKKQKKKTVDMLRRISRIPEKLRKNHPRRKERELVKQMDAKSQTMESLSNLLSSKLAKYISPKWMKDVPKLILCKINDPITAFNNLVKSTRRVVTKRCEEEFRGRPLKDRGLTIIDMSKPELGKELDRLANKTDELIDAISDACVYSFQMPLELIEVMAEKLDGVDLTDGSRMEDVACILITQERPKLETFCNGNSDRLRKALAREEVDVKKRPKRMGPLLGLCENNTVSLTPCEMGDVAREFMESDAQKLTPSLAKSSAQCLGKVRSIKARKVIAEKIMTTEDGAKTECLDPEMPNKMGSLLDDVGTQNLLKDCNKDSLKQAGPGYFKASEEKEMQCKVSLEADPEDKDDEDNYCNAENNGDVSDILTLKMLEKEKEEQEDETEISRKKRNTILQGMTAIREKLLKWRLPCSILQDISLGKLESSQIENIDKEEFEICIEPLGNYMEYPDILLPILTKKVKQVYGEVSTWPADIIHGPFVAGMNDAEVRQLDLNDLDILERLTYSPYFESLEKYKWLLGAVMKDVDPVLFAKDMTPDFLSAMGNLICAFTTDQLKALNDEAISENAEMLGTLRCFSYPAMELLNERVVSVLGGGELDIERISMLGNLLAGHDFTKIPDDLVRFLEIDKGVMKEVPQEKWKTVSKSQASRLTREQALSFSDELLEWFHEEVGDIIKRTKDGRDEKDESDDDNDSKPEQFDVMNPPEREADTPSLPHGNRSLVTDSQQPKNKDKGTGDGNGRPPNKNKVNENDKAQHTNKDEDKDRDPGSHEREVDTPSLPHGNRSLVTGSQQPKNKDKGTGDGNGRPPNKNKVNENDKAQHTNKDEDKHRDPGSHEREVDTPSLPHGNRSLVTGSQQPKNKDEGTGDGNGRPPNKNKVNENDKAQHTNKDEDKDRDPGSHEREVDTPSLPHGNRSLVTGSQQPKNKDKGTGDGNGRPPNKNKVNENDKAQHTNKDEDKHTDQGNHKSDDNDRDPNKNKEKGNNNNSHKNSEGDDNDRNIKNKDQSNGRRPVDGEGSEDVVNDGANDGNRRRSGLPDNIRKQNFPNLKKSEIIQLPNTELPVLRLAQLNPSEIDAEVIQRLEKGAHTPMQKATLLRLAENIIPKTTTEYSKMLPWMSIQDLKRSAGNLIRNIRPNISDMGKREMRKLRFIAKETVSGFAHLKASEKKNKAEELLRTGLVTQASKPDRDAILNWFGKLTLEDLQQINFEKITPEFANELMEKLKEGGKWSCKDGMLKKLTDVTPKRLMFHVGAECMENADDTEIEDMSEQLSEAAELEEDEEPEDVLLPTVRQFAAKLMKKANVMTKKAAMPVLDSVIIQAVPNRYLKMMPAEIACDKSLKYKECPRSQRLLLWKKCKNHMTVPDSTLVTAMTGSEIEAMSLESDSNWTTVEKFCKWGKDLTKEQEITLYKKIKPSLTKDSSTALKDTATLQKIKCLLKHLDPEILGSLPSADREKVCEYIGKNQEIKTKLETRKKLMELCLQTQISLKRIGSLRGTLESKDLEEEQILESFDELVSDVRSPGARKKLYTTVCSDIKNDDSKPAICSMLIAGYGNLSALNDEMLVKMLEINGRQCGRARKRMKACIKSGGLKVRCEERYRGCKDLIRRTFKAKQTSASPSRKKRSTRIRRDQAEDCKLTCDDIIMAGTEAVLVEPDVMKTMCKSEFEDCAATLGRLSDYTPELRAAVLEVAIKHWKDPKTWTATMVQNMGAVILAMSTEQLETLPVSSLEIVYSIGKHSEWNEHPEKLPALFANWFRTSKMNNVSAITSVDLQSLGHIGCGINTDLIEQIPVDVYSDAAKQLGALDTCNVLQLRAWAQKALESFGPVTGWGRDTVATIGSVIGGLSKAEIERLTVVQIQAISYDTIPTIPAMCFSKFTENQMKSFLSLQAAYVTEEQLQSLPKSKREILETKANEIRSQAIVKDPYPDGGGAFVCASLWLLLTGLLAFFLQI